MPDTAAAAVVPVEHHPGPRNIMITDNPRGDLTRALELVGIARQHRASVIIQLGGLGCDLATDSGALYVTVLGRELAERDIELWVVGGASHARHAGHSCSAGRVWVGTSIGFLPAGYAWRWHEWTWSTRRNSRHVMVGETPHQVGVGVAGGQWRVVDVETMDWLRSPR